MRNILLILVAAFVQFSSINKAFANEEDIQEIIEEREGEKIGLNRSRLLISTDFVERDPVKILEKIIEVVEYLNKYQDYYSRYSRDVFERFEGLSATFLNEMVEAAINHDFYELYRFSVSVSALHNVISTMNDSHPTQTKIKAYCSFLIRIISRVPFGDVQLHENATKLKQIEIDVLKAIRKSGKTTISTFVSKHPWLPEKYSLNEINDTIRNLAYRKRILNYYRQYDDLGYAQLDKPFIYGINYEGTYILDELAFTKHSPYSVTGFLENLESYISAEPSEQHFEIKLKRFLGQFDGKKSLLKITKEINVNLPENYRNVCLKVSREMIAAKRVLEKAAFIRLPPDL